MTVCNQIKKSQSLQQAESMLMEMLMEFKENYSSSSFDKVLQ